MSVGVEDGSKLLHSICLVGSRGRAVRLLAAHPVLGVPLRLALRDPDRVHKIWG